MDRAGAGMLLKRYLGRHRDAEQRALGVLPEDDYDAQMAAIEAASKGIVDGLDLEVRRRRSIDWCPFNGCRHSRLRKPCDHSNVRFRLTDPESGATARGIGLLWHLMAEHPAREEFGEDEQALVRVLNCTESGG